MPQYMSMPQFRIECGSTPTIFSNEKSVNFKVTRVENGFDVASILFSDAKSIHRSTIVKDSAISIKVKDAKETAWYTLLTGQIRFVTEGLGPEGETILAKCDGSGYGFAETVCGQEYGTQSSNPTMDSLKEIVTDSTYGIVPKWVNKVLGTATASGYAYDVTLVDDVAGDIPYLYFPFKPNSKCLNDLIDVMQAIKGANPGPHWLITPDNYLLVTPVGSHSTDAVSKGWTTYVGGSVASATVTEAVDLKDPTFESLNELANYILYYGLCVWPPNKDKATESNASEYEGYPVADVSFADETTNVLVGNASIDVVKQSSDAPYYAWWPSTEDLGLDLTALGGNYNVPMLSWWMRRDANYHVGNGFTVYLAKTINDLSIGDVDAYYLTLPEPTEANKWQLYTVPVGPHWKNGEISTLQSAVTGGWVLNGAGTWSEINSILFAFDNSGHTAHVYLDGLHFSGWLLRAAKDSTLIASKKLKLRVINDPFGKYDTLHASDDSGTIAQMCKAELLRSRTTPIIGTFTTAMIRNALPGQLLHVQARKNAGGTYNIDKDMRIIQVMQEGSRTGYKSSFTVTDDVVNAMTRTAYDSVNELLKSYRPEWQDKQSSGTKMRDIDITQSILEKDYPS